MGDEEKQACNVCIMKIPASAKVCHHCGQYQRRIVRWIVTYLQHAGLLIAIIMMGLGIATLKEAQEERIDAGVALKTAQAIEKRINDSGIVLSKALLTLSRWDATTAACY